MGKKYVIRLDKGLDYTSPALYTPPGSMLYPAANVRIDQNSAKKRWGYHTTHRSLGSVDVQHIVDYQLKAGTSATRHTLYLTSTDLIKKNAGTGEVSDWSSLTEAATPYTVPTGERWTWAIVDDLFCFTNGNENVQYWDGADYAIDLETALTVAVNARYCIEFANRLIIADYGDPRDPLGLAWSKEGDPENWTASSAGAMAFLQSADFITGLGKIGTSLFVYKEDSYHVGNRTGNAFKPLEFPVHKLGIGLFAPYSLVDFMGTNAFLGRDNFYAIVGIYPQPIGDAIQEFFFSEVTQAEAKKVWGFVNELEHEISWVAETTNYDQLCFTYNWFERKWYIYHFHDVITGAGRGI